MSACWPQFALDSENGTLWKIALDLSGTNPMATPATPLDAISAILHAFQTHRVVALCDGGHGCEQAYDFRVSLIRDPQFTETVNDIVVECGNSLYQGMMDLRRAHEECDRDGCPVEIINREVLAKGRRAL